MLDLPTPGLYRVTQAMPGNETAFPAGCLVYVGTAADDSRFIVRPGRNDKNTWYWGEPTTPLRSPLWAKTLHKLPSEGFYVLPETLEFDGGAKWLANAIVQLGYNGEGKGILFVAERHEGDPSNSLHFSDRGYMASDELMARLLWAPILPLSKADLTERNKKS